jgi:hypothetical protein
MKPQSFLFLSLVSVLVIAACSPQAPAVNPGVAGAGVATEIVGVDHDSTGYTVRFRMTNRDTSAVGFGACTGEVQVPVGSGWKSVTNWGQCQLSLIMLPPAQSVVLSIPRQALAAGDSIRVGLSWSFVSTRGSSGSSTSDPIVVP